MTIITNARYVLMGFALNQRLPEDTPMSRRLLAGLCITDEIFGITIAKQGYIEPTYSFGALIVSAPLWALGTALGITVGNILPAQIVSSAMRWERSLCLTMLSAGIFFFSASSVFRALLFSLIYPAIRV